MAEITKRALIATMKDLLEEVPFEKITVTQICEECGINRKTFYYHFDDKYDLVNKVYDIEFMGNLESFDLDDGWAFLASLCEYLHENRDYYQKAFAIKGQNCFTDYFELAIKPVVVARVKNIIGAGDNAGFYEHFFSDAFISSIKRWVNEDESVSPREFLSLVRSCLLAAAEGVRNQKIV